MFSGLIMSNSVDSDMRQFSSLSFNASLHGVKLIVTGAVHGNETCGTQAILRLIQALKCGQLQLISGQLTLVPVTNPLAYRLQQRHGERNLNRRLRPTFPALEFEDHVANWLCPLLAQHDVLLDLHSFRAEGQAFVMLGPENNQGSLEPFAFAGEEQALALCLGVHRLVDGWLSTYARGTERRRNQFDGAQESPDPQFGVGTTEYMRSTGGYALTLECGQHLDPNSPEVAYQAICNTLRQLGMLAGEKAAPVQQKQAWRLYEVVDKLHAKDSLAHAWASFDQLKKGQLIGIRADGSPVLAPLDGCIVFPDAHASAGEEWFYLAMQNPRFA